IHRRRPHRSPGPSIGGLRGNRPALLPDERPPRPLGPLRSSARPVPPLSLTPLAVGGSGRRHTHRRRCCQARTTPSLGIRRSLPTPPLPGPPPVRPSP